MQHTRSLADYTAEPPTLDEVDASLRLADAFVTAMKLALGRT